MEVLRQIFTRPFEVTQFWASDKYSVTARNAGDTAGHLYKYCPGHVLEHRPTVGGDWFFEICDGDCGPFIGDFLPRILPTRNNLLSLKDACIKASKFLSAKLEDGGIEDRYSDNDVLFPRIEPYRGQGEMNVVNNEPYRLDLWKVFAEDWGLELPAPDRFGIDTVTITHRPGLPCAAAMVRSVLPIIEAVHGELKIRRQSTSNEGNRCFDVVEYQRGDGRTLTQRYDITDVWGRNDLDWKFMRF